MLAALLPACLLLCSPRWITTGPGGHCFYFAKSISHPVWSWHSQEEVRSEPHSLSPILEFSSFLESLWWNQVSKEAENFCISSNFAIVTNVDYAELHGVVPPTPGVTGKMCTHDLVSVRTHDSTTWSNSLSNHLLDDDARQEKMHRHHLLKDWGGQTIGWAWQGELPCSGDLVKLRICNGGPGCLV